MTYYVATSELEGFSYSGATTNTTAGQFDSTYCRSGINVGGSAYFSAYLTNAVSELWVHFEMILNSTNNSAGNAIIIRNSLEEDLLRIGVTSGNLTHGYYNSSGTLVTLFSDPNGIPGGLLTYDVHIIAGGIGTTYVRVYTGGILLAQFVGTSTRFTNVQRVLFLNPTLVGNATYSQIIVADTPTTGRKLALRAINADSATNLDWSGTYTDVNENGINDATMITSDTANDVSTFLMSQISGLPSTTSVEAVVLSLRAQRSASGPQNLQGALRVGSNNFFSSNVSGLSTAQGVFVVPFYTNPDTGLKWVYADANSTTLEAGVKSIT